MKKPFKNLDDNKRIMLYTAILILVVALLYLPFCIIFPSVSFLFSLLWGWLLGGSISIAAFALLVHQIYSLTSGDEKIRLRVMGLHFVRLALYGAGLILAAVLMYLDKPWINIFAVVVAYMPIRLFVYFYKRKAKD